MIIILKHRELFRRIVCTACRSNVVRRNPLHTQAVKYSLKNHYQVLGVRRDATKKEIKDQYIKLSKLHHPDHQQDPEKLEESYEEFIKIAEAYEVLSDSKKRTGYDLEVNEKLENFSKVYAATKKPQKDEDSELTEEEKQIKQDEKNARDNLRNSPVFRLLGYLYAFICIVGLLMWGLGGRGNKSKNNDE